MKLRTPTRLVRSSSQRAFRSPNGRSPTNSPRTLSSRCSVAAKCVRGQAHEIAIKLGLKAGEICTDPAKALEVA